MTTKRADLKIRNVKSNVSKAISHYCKEKEITQAKYLETDKRLKDFLSPVNSK